MSGSETGVLPSNREAFGLQSPSQPIMQNMRLYSADANASLYKPAISTTAATNTTTAAAASPNYQPSSASATAVGGGGEGLALPGEINVNLESGGDAMMKRKRGRPRKYGPDGTMSFAVSLPFQSVAVNQSTGSGASGFSSPTPAITGAVSPQSVPILSGGSASPNSMKKRGRPPGSSNKKQQLQALGSAGLGFTPHVITVKAGEDVSSKIMSFSQHGPRAVCILSANGAISNVTLRQPATSGGTVTYEGRFEILSLSGSFMLSESEGQRSRTGGLSVSLSGPDGRVLGGGVAGLLTAASPVQVVVGSFLVDGRKELKSANQQEPLSAMARFPPTAGSTGASSPPSRGTLSESSGGPGSPLNLSSGACNNSNPQGISGMPWK